MKRKNIKNDKVLRAITIGLATMIAATSAPLDVLANEETSEDTTGEGETDTTTSNPEFSESSTDISEAAPACDNAVKYSGTEEDQAQDLISDAQNIIAGTEEDSSTIAEYEAAYDMAVSAPVVADGEQIADPSQQTIQQNLSEAQAAVQQVQADLANDVIEIKVVDDNGEETTKNVSVQDQINNALTHSQEGAAAVQEANNEIGSANAKVIGYNTADTQATNNADDAIDSADKANNAETKEEAEAAKAAAENSLEQAKTKLGEAEKAYSEAEAAVGNAEDKLEEAKAKYDQAQEELESTKEQLKNANTNATAANERMKAAKAKVDALAKDYNTQKENVKELNEIKEQAYAMMVYYLRKEDKGFVRKGTDSEGNKFEHTKWNDDRSMNIADTVASYKEMYGNNRTNHFAENSSFMIPLGRYMTKLLVEHMINADENVDPETANIQFGIPDPDVLKVKGGKQDTGKMKYGTVFTNGWGYDDVSLTETDEATWNRPGKGDNGTDNYVLVKYTDKEGVEQTRKFNYVFKSSEHADKVTDVENGVFYLAEIDENGKAQRVHDVNNFDNYTRLVETLEAIEAEIEFEKAQNAVKAAADKVDALQKKVEKLQNISIDRSALEKAQKELEMAQEELGKAEEKKTVLANKVQEAQAAVDNIDISQFEDSNDGNDSDGTENTSDDAADTATIDDDSDDAGDTSDGAADTATTDDDSDDAGDTSDGAAAGETVIPGPGGFTYTIPGGFTLPATLLDGTTGTDATGASGVLGVRTGGGNGAGGTEADEGGAADSRTNVAPRADFGTVNKVLGSKQNKDNSQIVKKIKDNEIPLAEIPNMDDEVTMNWMWLLIIFLLGATGKKMYDEYKKKKEAEEAAKINK